MKMIELFSVPFFHRQLNISNEHTRLLHFLGAQRSHSEHTFDYRHGLSNTGWHSEQWTERTAPDELLWLIEHFEHFLSTSLQTLLDHHLAPGTRTITAIEKEIVMWSTTNVRDDFNLKHVHTSAWRDTWSVVYYVAVPEDMQGGELRFTNPNLADRCSLGTLLSKYGAQTMYKTIKPSTGDLFLFPGWLEHDVLPFDAAGQRVVVAANIGIKSMTAPRTDNQ